MIASLIFPLGSRQHLICLVPHSNPELSVFSLLVSVIASAISFQWVPVDSNHLKTAQSALFLSVFRKPNGGQLTFFEPLSPTAHPHSKLPQESCPPWGTVTRILAIQPKISPPTTATQQNLNKKHPGPGNSSPPHQSPSTKSQQEATPQQLPPRFPLLRSPHPPSNTG